MNKKQTILIVEDDPESRELIGACLSQIGYSIESAENGEEALQLFHAKKPDLVLLDVQLPGESGFDICQTIRKQKCFDEIPILFLTGLRDRVSVLKGFELGAQDYIIKPFDLSELVARVRTHLELKRSRELLSGMNKELEERVKLRTEELAKANQNLANLSHANTDFMEMISHEIRSPLNGILAPVSMLKQELEDSDLMDLLELLDESVTKLERFSRRTVMITRLKTGKHEIRHDRIILNDLLRQAISSVQEEIDSKKLNLQLNDFSHDLAMTGDIDLLVVCINSLLENAVQTTPYKGDVSVSITSDSDNSLICKISDKGPGFPEMIIKSLNSSNLASDEHDDYSVGMGLALCKLILCEHKGKIEIANSAEGGGIVTLTFTSKLIS